MLGWLSVEGSGGGAPTIPAGGSRPSFCATRGKGRPGEGGGQGETAGSKEAPSVPTRAGTTAEALWLRDRTAQAPVVFLRRHSPETDALNASALAMTGGLGLLPASAERLAGAVAPAGAGRGGPRNQSSGGSEEDAKISTCRDERYTAATPAPFVPAREEVRARDQKRKESAAAATIDGSRGETTPAVEEDEVRLDGLAQRILCHINAFSCCFGGDGGLIQQEILTRRRHELLKATLALFMVWHHRLSGVDVVVSAEESNHTGGTLCPPPP